MITGASAGLGKEFARLHAAYGGDVILTARREGALLGLKSELEGAHGITAHVFALDLGAEGGADALYEAVANAGLTVDILINNAGFGGQGIHIERALADEQAMIDLNVKALVTLTHRFGADMVKRGGGKILNVGSTAGFMPGPNQAVYFATKAFVNSFSQAVDEELRSKGVTVSVLAPGYVETEFAQAANLENTAMVKAGGAQAADVAKIGYDAMNAGKLVTINETRLSVLLNWIIPLLPRRAVLRMMGKMQQNV
ncbi:MAG: SDR family oxidoreductase [Dinoroseobacter sp.]|nr:SDR family oxidoreductase [Dinoroseobacter sp.]